MKVGTMMMMMMLMKTTTTMMMVVVVVVVAMVVVVVCVEDLWNRLIKFSRIQMKNAQSEKPTN